MLIFQRSTLTLLLPNNLKAKLRVSQDFHTFGTRGCELLFLDPSLLHKLIESVNSVSAAQTKNLMERIRASDQSVIGDVAYLGAAGDRIRALSTVSEMAAIGMLSCEYLPVLANVEAVKIFKNHYVGRYSEELPVGWSLVSGIEK